MRVDFRGVVVGVVLLMVSSLPALATVTEYTSRDAFNAAVSGATTYGFDGLGPSDSYIRANPVVGGVTFTSPGNLFLMGADAGFGFYGTAFVSGQGYLPTVVASMSGISAIGFTVGSYIDKSLPSYATLSTGEVFSFLTPAANGVDTSFIGFISSSPLTSVAISGPGSWGIDVTSVTVATPGAVAAVPEPGTWAMLLVGVGLVGLRLKGSGAKSFSSAG